LLLFLQPYEEMTVLMSKQDFPTISFCAIVFYKIFSHLEKYIVNTKRGLKGINPTTKKPYADWIRMVAQKCYDKLDSYYPSSDGLVYVLGTGTLSSYWIYLIFISEFQYSNYNLPYLFSNLVLDPRCKMEWFKNAKFSNDVLRDYKRFAIYIYYKIQLTFTQNAIPR
jgi:hypothetical protein